MIPPGQGRWRFRAETRAFEEPGTGRKVVLRRIEAVRPFGSVAAGEIGGWLENRSNLEEDGEAWVAGEAVVCGRSRVEGGAAVKGEAVVVDSRVAGGAAVADRARLVRSEVAGRVLVCHDASLEDAAVVPPAECAVTLAGFARLKGRRISLQSDFEVLSMFTGDRVEHLTDVKGGAAVCKGEGKFRVHSEFGAYDVDPYEMEAQVGTASEYLYLTGHPEASKEAKRTWLWVRERRKSEARQKGGLH